MPRLWFQSIIFGIFVKKKCSIKMSQRRTHSLWRKRQDTQPIITAVQASGLNFSKKTVFTQHPSTNVRLLTCYHYGHCCLRSSPARVVHSSAILLTWKAVLRWTTRCAFHHTAQKIFRAFLEQMLEIDKGQQQLSITSVRKRKSALAATLPDIIC